MPRLGRYRVSASRDGARPDAGICFRLGRYPGHRKACRGPPDRVILFGSAVRGTAGPEIDLDFLVIKRGVTRRRQAAQAVCRALVGIQGPKRALYLISSTRARWPGALASGASHVTMGASSASANAIYMAS